MSAYSSKDTITNTIDKIGNLWRSKVLSKNPNSSPPQDDSLLSAPSLRSMTTKKTKKTTKKSAKKTSTKKTTRKAAKRSSKATKGKEKQAPIYAEGEQCFWVNNGPVLVSLADLHEALKAMDNDQYNFHAKGDQNDFAEWVQYVLCDEDCAASLRKARSRNGATTVVKRRLTVYAF